MRRFLSILLLAFFGLALASPLLGLGVNGDAGLPACCRRTGKHHCAMGTADRNQDQHGPTLSMISEKCPCCPGVIPSMQPNVLGPPAAGAIYAHIVSHPACVAQTESKWRIARDRSRQKRGPPVLLPA